MTTQDLASLAAAICLAQLLSLAAHQATAPARAGTAASLSIFVEGTWQSTAAWLEQELQELAAAGALEEPELTVYAPR